MRQMFFYVKFSNFQCRQLISANAQCIYSTPDVLSPLVLAVQKRQSAKLLRMIIDTGAPLDGISDNSRCSVRLRHFL